MPQGARPKPRRADDKERSAIRDRAHELTKSGMPYQMAMAVAQGRLELNEALERLARRNEVEQLMRKYELNRALATQIALGHADLEQFLFKRRLGEHREAHRDRSVLDEAAADGVERAFALHGKRLVRGVVSAVDAYHATITGSDGEEQHHKLQFKYAYDPADWKRVRKVLKKDKDLSKSPKDPIDRPQDRYTISDRRLFGYHDQSKQIDVTLLEGEQLRGQVAWFGRYEFGLTIKGDVEMTIFRHALANVRSVA